MGAGHFFLLLLGAIWNRPVNCTCYLHCESGEGLWLQGDVALQTNSFRDREPDQVIPPNKKKKYVIFLKQLRQGIGASLSTTYLGLPMTA